MNNKLHLSDLASELATKTHKREDLTDSFLRELFTLIEEALLTEQLVKIKEIGTFKLQLVNARRIANVQTGENQEVAEHYKVVFTPDKRLASLVNEPYRHLSSVEIFENGEFKVIDTGKDDIDEIVDLSVDYEPTTDALMNGTSLSEETINQPSNPLKEKEPETPFTSLEPPPDTVVEQVLHAPIILPKMNVQTLAELYQEDEPTPTKQAEPTPKGEGVQVEPIVCVVEPNPLEQEAPEEPNPLELPIPQTIEQPIAPSKKSRGWIVATVLLLIAAGLSFYYITHHRVPSNQIFQVVIGEPTPEEIADSIREAKTDSIKADIKAEPPQPLHQPLDTLKYEATRYLTQISRQYYGNKYFWVYIYEENKDKIVDFNNVRSGTLLVIPAPEKYGINADDTTSLNKAKEIGSRLVLEREERMKKNK